jgi:hypothetical protein
MGQGKLSDSGAKMNKIVSDDRKKGKRKWEPMGMGIKGSGYEEAVATGNGDRRRKVDRP